MVLHPDDRSVKVIIAIQVILFLHFRFAVGRTWQETEKRPQSSADIASAIAAASGKLISLHHFPHIGMVGNGQTKEVGFFHIVRPVFVLIYVLKPVQTHGII